MELPKEMQNHRVLNDADTVVNLTAFNMDLQFDPLNQLVIVGFQMSRSKTRYQFYFGRLEFGKWLASMQQAFERAREDNLDSGSQQIG